MDNEETLTVKELFYYLRVIDSPDKQKSRKMFKRQGENRRQDHGNRDTASKKGHGRKYYELDYFGMPDDYELGRRHKDYRRGSEDQTRGVIRSYIQREMKIVELNEALLEAGLFFWHNLVRFDFCRHEWYPMGQIVVHSHGG